MATKKIMFFNTIDSDRKTKTARPHICGRAVDLQLTIFRISIPGDEVAARWWAALEAAAGGAALHVGFGGGAKVG